MLLKEPIGLMHIFAVQKGAEICRLQDCSLQMLHMFLSDFFPQNIASPTVIIFTYDLNLTSRLVVELI